MKKFLLLTAAIAAIFYTSDTSSGQAPTLGTTATFALFTAAGAFNNAGPSVVTGDVGTNVGAFNAFPPGVLIGTIHVADPASSQAASDVATAYSDLFSLTCGMVIGTTLGNNQTLGPNIYCTGAASTINGTLVLDAQGNPNALFIFKIGGALSTSTFSTISLINGANFCNVYWQVNGQFDLGDNSVFRGTLIANGAINLLSGSTVFGRALSTAGAISTNTVVVTRPCENASGPVVTCPANAIVQCANQVPPANIANVTAVDACGQAVTITVAPDVITNQTCANRFTISRTYSAVDLCGHVGSCTQTITVNDNTPPTISCPANVTVTCASLVPAVNISAVITSNNCGGTSVTSHIGDVISAQTCANRFTITRTYRAIDDCGNSANCSQLITVFDQTPPVINCPGNVTVQCGASTLPANTGVASGNDNCGGVPTISFTDNGSGACSTNFARTWTATDACGNTSVCVQTITVFGVTSTTLTITCPGNVAVGCANQVPAPAPGNIVTTSTCPGIVTVTVSPDIVSNATCANRFTITRTYTATNTCGNIATCAQTITVFDNTPPSITCPANVTVQCAGQIPAPNINQVVSADNCGGLVTTVFVNDVISAQTCANRYTVTRTYMSTDACGNVAICAQIITVFDNTAPSISCPANVTVQCAGQIPSPNVALVTSADNCGGLATVVFVNDVISAQTCANRYTVTRTYMSTDPCGNTATCAQIITVFDNTLPTFTCPVNLTVTCLSAVPLPNTSLLTGADNCGGTPVFSFVADVLSGQLCLNNLLVVRTYRATDACGNSATCSQVITVLGNTPLSITCPANLTFACASLVPAPNPASVITTSNCGANATVTFLSDVVSNQTCANHFTITRTYVATDACGNTVSCTQLITVNDNTPPVITLSGLGVPNGGTIQVQCFGQNPNWDLPVYTSGNATAVDNCTGTVSVAFTQILLSQGECNTDGYINRYRLTWTASDVCGNSSTAFVFLELIDTIPPVILGVPNDITVNCNAIPEPAVITATDECLCACVVLFSQSLPVAGCQNGQVITRTWTAKDRCGNMTTQTQSITLIDNAGPVLSLSISGMPLISGDTTLNYTCSNGGIPPSFDLLNAGSIVANTSCGSTPQVTFSQTGSTPRNCEFFGFVEEQQYSWTAMDQCGNQTTLTLTAHVLDTEPPVLVGVPAMTCLGDPALKNVEAVDNCGQGSVSFWDVRIPNPCGNGIAFRRTYEGSDPCGNTVRDTVILLPNAHEPLLLSFVDPAMNLLDTGAIFTINCAGSSNQLTPFGLNDVSLGGGCEQRMLVNFKETLLQSGNCLTNDFISLVELKWTAKDFCGDSSQLSLMVKIVDDTPPVFLNLKSEVRIGCHDTMPEIRANDNCSAVTISTIDHIIPSHCDFEYDVIRDITITDACGNVSTGTQTVHVGTGAGPVIHGVDAIVCNDQSIPVVTAFDGCAETFVNVTMMQDTTENECGDGLVIRRTWSAEDACGRISVVYQTIILNDTVPPVILVPTWSIIRKFMDNENNFIQLSQTDIMTKLNSLNEGSVFVTDECDVEIRPVFTVDTIHSINCILSGYSERRTYSWIATDVCGNSAILSFTVDISDDVPPAFINVQIDTTVACAPLPDVPVVFAQDSGIPVVTTFTQTIVPGVSVGVFIVTRIWTAIDACGNNSTLVQVIRWIPNTFLACEIILPPVIQCNSHGVVITTDVTGGAGPYSYQWEISGEKCFIQGGQGTPTITIYVGWTDVKVILTVTDAFGCTSMCMIIVECTDGNVSNLSTGSQYVNPDTNPEERSIASGMETSHDLLQQLNLWPNPANENLNLSFESAVDQNVEFVLMNFLGEVVLKEKSMAHKGFNAKNFNVSDLPQSSYMMEVKSASEIHSKVIVLTHKE